MAARKLQQEVEKCFKKVAEGVIEFETIYDKIELSNNAAQKEKLEDNLKREIKKLQRLRDQIKTWATSNDIKDKAPLLEQRKLIETQMEKFKAIEKAMKTKAYSREGLSAAAKLDPKEQAKLEASDFLCNMVEELDQQIESLEAESEGIQATMKKGKGQSAKADRMAQIERVIERHKWHQGKLELIRRSLENGGVEAEQVNGLEESIRYYVSDCMNEDFVEDEELYNDLNLNEDEDAFGILLETEKGSSQDTKSEPEEILPESEAKVPVPPLKGRTDTGSSASGRRPSTHMKSPLPVLASLFTTIPPIPITNPIPAVMKPAVVPTRPAGEPLKYASAAAAATSASERSIGLVPLPPPLHAPQSISPSLHTQQPLPQQLRRASVVDSPALSTAQLVAQQHQDSVSKPASTPATASANPSPAVPAVKPIPPLQVSPTPKTEPIKPLSRALVGAKVATPTIAPAYSAAPATTAAASTPIPAAVPAALYTIDKAEVIRQTALPINSAHANGRANGHKPVLSADEESIYHLPSSLQDLVDSFDTTRKRPAETTSAATLRMLSASQAGQPALGDADVPRRYRADLPVAASTSGYPREPLALLDDPRLYSKVDQDTLFYVFYYKQGTAQQYLAAKALKEQSWRFHKQYQTWFQRHEEPKTITEEFEQGTYRFFDYESTWMNRRKADFKFAYKFLEDDVE